VPPFQSNLFRQVYLFLQLGGCLLDRTFGIPSMHTALGHFSIVLIYLIKYLPITLGSGEVERIGVESRGWL